MHTLALAAGILIIAAFALVVVALLWAFVLVCLWMLGRWGYASGIARRARSSPAP